MLVLRRLPGRHRGNVGGIVRRLVNDHGERNQDGTHEQRDGCIPQEAAARQALPSSSASDPPDRSISARCRAAATAASNASSKCPLTMGPKWRR